MTAPVPASVAATATTFATASANKPTSEFFTQIPKVELHCHLLGTVRKETFAHLVAKADSPLTSNEVELFYTRGEKPVGAIRVLRALDEFLLRTPDDFYRITIEYLQDAAAHNVRYCEFSWNPTGSLQFSGLSYLQIIQAMQLALNHAQQQWGIQARIIAAIDREAPVAAAEQMLELVLANRCEPVIGIGIDYREEHFPPQLFTAVYQRAKSAGLLCTAHAGEFGMPWTNVRSALNDLKVDRIDHGYTVLDNPQLLQECVDRGIVFTVVPTNSYYLRTLPKERWALDHPIRQMQRAGLKLHPNTDDPTLHHVNPTQAWQMMADSFDFTRADLQGCMLNGIDAAWVDELTKKHWRNDWLQEFNEASAVHTV
jgi:adenine deaminase